MAFIGLGHGLFSIENRPGMLGLEGAWSALSLLIIRG
jgi:hypothetical protein